MNSALDRVTLEDVAQEAGVSLATVDRVINGRPGVHDRTIGRVQAAISKLNYRPDPAAVRLARGSRSLRFCFVLPASRTSFVELLSSQLAETAKWLESQRAFVDVREADVFDPDVLAALLESLGERYDGIATIALDHPRVRAALDDLAAAGKAVVTLVSDAPTANRLRYIGIDNAAAGRTAATLMGRFAAGRTGRIGLIAGSLALRDHAERRFGFTQVLESEYSGLSALPPQEGRDDYERNRAIAEHFLQMPDVVGIYNMGAGNRGVAAALEASGRAAEVIFIGHELTPHTRRFLVRGTMDACINQDAGHEIRSAARVLLAQCLKEPLMPDQERIRIDIFIRDNMP